MANENPIWQEPNTILKNVTIYFNEVGQITEALEAKVYTSYVDVITKSGRVLVNWSQIRVIE
jgi:repressor of nif and glnA expression